MNITNENPVMIFKREYQGNTFYSLGLSKKKQNGGYENGYINCQFKKDVSVEDKTKIYIKQAWLTFYLDKSNKTIPYIFINEFTTVEQTIEQTKEEVKQNNDPFEEFSKEANLNELEVSAMDLPF